MSRVLLIVAVLSVQSTVDAAEIPKEASPVDHGVVLDICNCTCELNATWMQLVFCPSWGFVPTAAAPPPIPAPAPAPASDIALLPRALYKFVGCEGALPWRAANETCARDGAHLAVPDSMSEVYMLLGMLIFHPSPEGNCSVFIGLHGNDGDFRTVLGKPMPEVIMNLWDKRDVPKENLCLSLDEDGRIEDVSCEARHAYACELPAD